MDLFRQSDVLCFNTLSSFPSKEKACFNFMATVTVCRDFGAQENKICHLLSHRGSLRGSNSGAVTNPKGIRGRKACLKLETWQNSGSAAHGLWSKLWAMVEDRGAWQATIHGSQRVKYNLASEQQQLLCIFPEEKPEPCPKVHFCFLTAFPLSLSSFLSP